LNDFDMKKSAGKYSYPEFDIPKGFQTPENLANDAEFESLATVRLKGDGKACIVALDGTPLGPDIGDEKSGEAKESNATDDRPGFVQVAMGAMRGGGQAGGGM
jgi:hypothetical protein